MDDGQRKSSVERARRRLCESPPLAAGPRCTRKVSCLREIVAPDYYVQPGQADSCGGV
jgi:hypothetical protein